jgi:TatD DNase family protein
VARFLRLVPEARWIGEIGLDFSAAGIHTRKQQLRIFETLLADPLLRARPITVHSRGAERDTITRLAQAKVLAIMHWYTGPLSVVDDALAAGLWFSVNPGMIRSAKSAAVLARVPSERVVLETDGPYAKLHRRAAEPPDILATLAHLAQLWNTTTAHARDIVAGNQATVCAGCVPSTPDDVGSPNPTG